jgi:hypothetical protein
MLNKNWKKKNCVWTSCHFMCPPSLFRTFNLLRSTASALPSCELMRCKEHMPLNVGSNALYERMFEKFTVSVGILCFKNNDYRLRKLILCEDVRRTVLTFFFPLALQPNSGLGRLHETFHFTSVTRSRTVGRTPWKGDQLIARRVPALKHRKTHTQHKH